VRLLPAASLATHSLAELFNDAYSDYLVPMRLDPDALDFTIDVTDIDLDVSRVAYEDDVPVAFAAVALRGRQAWVGGMGTRPAYRRRGLGEAALRAALEAARDRGANEVWLEVIEGNAGAIALYEKLGFECIRTLVVWMLDAAAPPSGDVRRADAAVAGAWIAANRPSPEPWQRADQTLSRMRRRGLELEGLVTGGDGGIAGAAVYRVSGGRASVLQIAARDDTAAADLLAAAGQAGGLRLINAPAGEPASRALEALGATIDVRQAEMRLRL